MDTFPPYYDLITLWVQENYFTILITFFKKYGENRRCFLFRGLKENGEFGSVVNPHITYTIQDLRQFLLRDESQLICKNKGKNLIRLSAAAELATS